MVKFIIYDKRPAMCIYDPSNDEWVRVYKDEDKYWKFAWGDDPCALSLGDIEDIREKSLPKLSKAGRAFLYIPTEYLKVLFWEKFGTDFKEALTDSTIDSYIQADRLRRLNSNTSPYGTTTWPGPH